MTIWIWDVPVLFALGMILARMHAKWFAVKHPDFFVHSGFIIIFVFWLNAIACAVGFQPWFGVESTHKIPGWIALFYVLSYPLWFKFGAERMFALFGRKPTQGGFMWLLTIKDRTKPFESPWKNSDF